jgi:hypothetical protein
MVPVPTRAFDPAGLIMDRVRDHALHPPRSLPLMTVLSMALLLGLAACQRGGPPAQTEFG